MFYKKNKHYRFNIPVQQTTQNKEWLKPSDYWNALLQKKETELTTVECILLDVYMRHHTLYKCKYGMLCTYRHCVYRHPTQYGYAKALYILNKKPCVYESETECCKKKCSNELGMYCIYAHCKHPNKDIIHCVQPDCQGHCNMCI